ncbi:FAD-dependent oxidoreductase [Streptomyces agglomeratus]|uniref:FAD-dependent oxidoreductase n=1 Tax=Streptomyces agglomeratus TaxID=285458 RepID=UPI0009A0499C|nr:FAD-dependent oxidoreductase [Streptomyces agglomeratus]
MAAKELPASLLVLGGGVIGVELAQVFARLGCAVTVLEGRERLLPAEEPEAGELAADVLRVPAETSRLAASRCRAFRADGGMST